MPNAWGLGLGQNTNNLFVLALEKTSDFFAYHFIVFLPSSISSLMNHRTSKQAASRNIDQTTSSLRASLHRYLVLLLYRTTSKDKMLYALFYSFFRRSLFCRISIQSNKTMRTALFYYF